MFRRSLGEELGLNAGALAEVVGESSEAGFDMAETISCETEF